MQKYSFLSYDCSFSASIVHIDILKLNMFYKIMLYMTPFVIPVSYFCMLKTTLNYFNHDKYFNFYHVVFFLGNSVGRY